MASTARHDPGEMRNASCRDRVLVEHPGDFPPAVDPAQLDLPTHHEAEEQGQRCVFAGQRALRLQAPAKLLVEPLNRVRGAQRLPLPFGEGEEREQFVAAFPKAHHHAWAALGPLSLKGRVSGAGGVGISRVDDAMEVVADLGQRMFRCFALEVAELVCFALLGSYEYAGGCHKKSKLTGMIVDVILANPRYSAWF